MQALNRQQAQKGQMMRQQNAARLGAQRNGSSLSNRKLRKELKKINNKYDKVDKKLTRLIWARRIIKIVAFIILLLGIIWSLTIIGFFLGGEALLLAAVTIYGYSKFMSPLIHKLEKMKEPLEKKRDKLQKQSQKSRLQRLRARNAAQLQQRQQLA